MASRLSESSLRRRRDAGHQNLPWLQEDASGLFGIDFDKLLSVSDSQALVQSLPPQVLYHAIKQNGVAESAEIISLASNDQFLRFLDYDAWPEDHLDLGSAIDWLMALRRRGPQALAQRYRALDEEYQIALIEKHVQVFTEEEAEALADDRRDRLIPLPCNTVFYEILTDDREIEAFIVALVNSALSYNVAYTYNLLAHAAYVPPNENELTLSQFRRARLEEDGFVPYDDSLRVFYPIDIEKLRAEWSLTSAIQSDDWLIPIDSAEESYVERVVRFGIAMGRWDQEQGVRFQQECLYLANAISTATHVEPSDISGVNRIVQQIQAMVSVGLEYISDGKEGVGLEILRVVYPKQLFQAGLTLLYKLQDQVVIGLSRKGLPHTEALHKYQQLQRWGLVQDFLDKQYSEQIPFEELQVIKGLFNRFPMRLVKQSDRLVYRPIASRKDYLELVNRLGVEWQVMS